MFRRFFLQWSPAIVENINTHGGCPPSNGCEGCLNHPLDAAKMSKALTFDNGSCCLASLSHDSAPTILLHFASLTPERSFLLTVLLSVKGVVSEKVSVKNSCWTGFVCIIFSSQETTFTRHKTEPSRGLAAGVQPVTLAVNIPPWPTRETGARFHAFRWGCWGATKTAAGTRWGRKRACVRDIETLGQPGKFHKILISTRYVIARLSECPTVVPPLSPVPSTMMMACQPREGVTLSGGNKTLVRLPWVRARCMPLKDVRTAEDTFSPIPGQAPLGRFALAVYTAASRAIGPSNYQRCLWASIAA